MLSVGRNRDGANAFTNVTRRADGRPANSQGEYSPNAWKPCRCEDEILVRACNCERKAIRPKSAAQPLRR
ncbi:hypothetical protein VUR80DRAFT_3606 [Thermomyces stellatus]